MVKEVESKDHGYFCRWRFSNPSISREQIQWSRTKKERVESLIVQTEKGFQEAPEGLRGYNEIWLPFRFV